MASFRLFCLREGGDNLKNRIMRNRLLCLLLLASMTVCLFSCSGYRRSEVSEYDRELSALVYEKQQLQIQKNDIEKGIDVAVVPLAYMSFIFTEVDAGLYSDVLPVLNEYGPFVGVMAFSEDELPGGEGNVTVEQYNELMNLGWGNALYWNGEGELSAFLDTMELALGDIGIEMPKSVLFENDAYSPDCDALLLERGIENAVHSGIEDYSIVEKTDPDGVWHPGYVGWRNLKKSTRLKSAIEANGGYSAFRIVFDNSPENFDTAYYHIEGESVSNGAREQVFGKMMSSFKKSVEAGTISVMTIEESRNAAEAHFRGVEEYQEYAKTRIAEIDAEIASVEKKILELYDKYH